MVFAFGVVLLALSTASAHSPRYLHAVVSASTAGSNSNNMSTPNSTAVGAQPAADELTLCRLRRDIDVLNYALTLEHLESAFYQQVLTAFPSAAHLNDSALAARGLNTTEVFTALQHVASDEATHVSALNSTITKLCSQFTDDFDRDLCGPVSPCTYNFSLHTASGVMKTLQSVLVVASSLEDVGVSAYDGQVKNINNKDILTTAATIATVEARHASYLRFLVQEIPFPAAFDTPRTRKEVLCIASGFIADKNSCTGFRTLAC